MSNSNTNPEPSHKALWANVEQLRPWGLVTASLILSVVIVINPNRLLWPYRNVEPAALQTVYIMDHDGAAFSFSSLKDSESVLLEVRDHMMRFHELMFNMIPDPRSIDEKTTKAFGYGDSSVMTFYQRIKEKGYYDDLIKSFSSTEFFLDSVVVDSKLPSGVKTYGKVLSVRESSATLFSVESSCIISSVGRCAANPHGLWIQKYSLDKFEETEKRKR